MRWFGRVEGKDDDWVKHCKVIEVDGTRQRVRERLGEVVSRRI